MGGKRTASALGLELLGLTGLFVTWQAHDPRVGLITTVLGTVLPSFLSIGLVAAGVWVTFTDDLDDSGVARVLEWSVAGMVGLGALGGLALFLQRRGYVIDQPLFVITSTVVSGAVAGFGIGFYDVYSNRRQTELEREREKLDHLNRLLRHHLLNGMNVMLANIDSATAEAGDPTVEERLDDARDRGEEIVALVEQVSALAATGEVTTDREVDIDRLLEGEAERVRAIHGLDAVSVVEPLPDVAVNTTESLGDALGVLIEDTVTSGGDRATVSATVDGETAVVSVSAAGGAAADGGEHVLGGPGSDVGLSVADVLVERAGGELVTPASTDDTVRVRLPVA